MPLLTDADLNAIALDLEACRIGEALTTGRRRAQYRQHRKACMAAIKADNAALNLPAMTDEELLAELGV